jgi:hypothetical protein
MVLLTKLNRRMSRLDLAFKRIGTGASLIAFNSHLRAKKKHPHIGKQPKESDHRTPRLTDRGEDSGLLHKPTAAAHKARNARQLFAVAAVYCRRSTCAARSSRYAVRQLPLEIVT